MEAPSHSTTTVAADPRHVSLTHLMYGLHAIAVLIGICTAATIAGRFLFSAPSIIAVIINYLKRDSVQGTWLASHFRWQLRTFWIAFGWLAAAWLVFGPFALILIGLPFLMLSYLAVGIWVTYRIARGWISLRDGRGMPDPVEH